MGFLDDLGYWGGILAKPFSTPATPEQREERLRQQYGPGFMGGVPKLPSLEDFVPDEFQGAFNRAAITGGRATPPQGPPSIPSPPSVEALDEPGGQPALPAGPTPEPPRPASLKASMGGRDFNFGPTYQGNKDFQEHAARTRYQASPGFMGPPTAQAAKPTVTAYNPATNRPETVDAPGGGFAMMGRDSGYDHDYRMEDLGRQAEEARVQAGLQMASLTPEERARLQAQARAKDDPQQAYILGRLSIVQQMQAEEAAIHADIDGGPGTPEMKASAKAAESARIQAKYHPQLQPFIDAQTGGRREDYGPPPLPGPPSP